MAAGRAPIFTSAELDENLELLHRLDAIVDEHPEWGDPDPPDRSGGWLTVSDRWPTAPPEIALAADLIEDASHRIDVGLPAKAQLLAAGHCIKSWEVKGAAAREYGKNVAAGLTRATAVALARRQREQTERRIDRILHGVSSSPRRLGAVPCQRARRRRTTSRRRTARAGPDSDPHPSSSRAREARS